MSHELRAVIKLVLKTFTPAFSHLLALTVDVPGNNSKGTELVVLRYIVLKNSYVIIFKEISSMETEVLWHENKLVISSKNTSGEENINI